MFSLALMVSFIVFTIVLSGPVVLILSRWDEIPSRIIYILSVVTILGGLWFYCLPIPGIRYFGILSAGLAFVAISHRRAKQTKG